MNRRQFLRGAGTVTVLVAGGGVWRSYDRGVWSVGGGPAYEPWHEWSAHSSEGPLALVRAGILAANPHNTQPWLFRVTDSRIELFADTSRNLGTFDAYRREMFLGLGCAIENMMLAARAHGYNPTLSLIDGTLDPPPAAGPPVAVARIDLAAAPPQPSELHDAIPRRRTNRAPFEPDRQVFADSLDLLGTAALVDPDVDIVFLTEPDARPRLGSLIVATTEAIIADEQMVHDSERWYRHSRAEIEEHRDGPTLDATGLPPARIAIAKFFPRPSAAANHAYWLDNTRQFQVPTAPVLGLILVRQLYDRRATLLAGRAWQRMHLLATTQGLAMQPLNQPVELVDRERSLGRESPTARALADFTTGRNGEPTFVFRLGHPERSVPASPRRPIDDVVV